MMIKGQNTASYSLEDVKNEISECLDMLRLALNYVLLKNDKPIITTDKLPRFAPKFFLNSQRKSMGIGDDELAFTEPAMSGKGFDLYVCKELLKYATPLTVHNVLMHEAIHLFCDKFYRNSYFENNGHSKVFVSYANAMKKKYGYIDLGEDGFNEIEYAKYPLLTSCNNCGYVLKAPLTFSKLQIDKIVKHVLKTGELPKKMKCPKCGHTHVSVEEVNI